MNIQLIAICTGILFVASIPIDSVLRWMFSRAKYIDDQLEKPHLSIFMSKRGFGFGFAQILKFAVGFGAYWALDYYIYSITAMVVMTPLILLAHRHSVFYRFKSQKNIMLLVWGMYAYIYWPMAIVFPILMVIYIVLLNTISLGFILTIFSAFFVFWLNLVDPFALLYNFMIFAVALYCERDHVSGYIEGKKTTLLQSFLSR
jgi:glycerol-3-phosphate acyltransferase PlsY